MGNNGPLYSDEMEALQKATPNVGELFLVNDHAPVSWIGRVQPRPRRSRRGLAAHDADRLARGGRRPRSLLWDSIHLTPAGAGVYARLVAGAVHTELRKPSLQPR